MDSTPIQGAHSIALDELVPLREARTRLGLGGWWFRSAQRNGLLVRRFGNRAFLLGQDLADFLAAQRKESD